MAANTAAWCQACTEHWHSIHPGQGVMPCYRLFCLAKPGLGREQQVAVIRTAATSILDGGGVLMDLRSFGEKALAYIVRPAGQAFDEVSC